MDVPKVDVNELKFWIMSDTCVFAMTCEVENAVFEEKYFLLVWSLKGHQKVHLKNEFIFDFALWKKLKISLVNFFVSTAVFFLC